MATKRNLFGGLGTPITTKPDSDFLLAAGPTDENAVNFEWGYLNEWLDFRAEALNQSWGESYMTTHAILVSNDSGFYYPNSGGNRLGKLKGLSLDHKASLIMIPSAGKAAVLYSPKPFTNGQFTVARASVKTTINKDLMIEELAANVPAIYYEIGETQPSVLLEPQRTNLITYPVSFDNAYWSTTDASVHVAPMILK